MRLILKDDKGNDINSWYVPDDISDMELANAIEGINGVYSSKAEYEEVVGEENQ